MALRALIRTAVQPPPVGPDNPARRPEKPFLLAESLDFAVMSTVPSPESSSAPTPPIAKQVPTERTHHGDTVTDPYAWLADPKDPEVIAYLEAENAYTEALTAGLGDLRSAVFDEIRARTQETDLSVPVRKGNWWRYTRTVEGQQYSIQCRRLVRDGEVTPPMPARFMRSTMAPGFLLLSIASSVTMTTHGVWSSSMEM